MKPKVALVKDGFLPAGSENQRGRMSAAGIKRCEELVALGWQIDGFASVSKPSDDSKAAKTVARVSVDPNRIQDVPDPLRDKRDWTLIEKSTGKPMRYAGMCNVCQVCGNSFTYCGCANPTCNSLDSTAPVPVAFKAVTQRGAG